MVSLIYNIPVQVLIIHGSHLEPTELQIPSEEAAALQGERDLANNLAKVMPSDLLMMLMLRQVRAAD